MFAGPLHIFDSTMPCPPEQLSFETRDPTKYQRGRLQCHCMSTAQRSPHQVGLNPSSQYFSRHAFRATVPEFPTTFVFPFIQLRKEIESARPRQCLKEYVVLRMVVVTSRSPDGMLNRRPRFCARAPPTSGDLHTTSDENGYLNNHSEILGNLGGLHLPIPRAVHAINAP